MATIKIKDQDVCLDTLFEVSDDLKKARLELNKIANESKKKDLLEG